MPMDDPYSLDPSKVRPAGGSKKSRVHGLVPVLATVAVAGVLGLLVLKVGPALLHAGPAQAQGIAGASTAETAVERELVTFADRFLMNYYNYSYTLYSEAVRRAEAMMTPEMQAVYSQHALDRQFIGLLQDKQVSTDGFRITPNSYMFRNEGKTHYFQLSGTMTYTTGVNDAQAEWPTTVLLEIVDTDQGFRVNNVQRLR